MFKFHLKCLSLVLGIAMASSLISCKAPGERIKIQKTEEPEIKYIAPEERPKIQLKYSNGRYSWTIKGTDPEEVIKADRTLRAYTEKEGLSGK